MTFQQIEDQYATEAMTDKVGGSFAHEPREALERRLQRIAAAVGEALRAEPGAGEPRRDQRHGGRGHPQARHQHHLLGNFSPTHFLSRLRTASSSAWAR